jgi:hypothetical protein
MSVEALRAAQIEDSPKAATPDARDRAGAPAAAPAGLPVPMEFLAQSPLELARAEYSYREAEREFGAGRVPADLDLGRYADERELELPEGERLVEPLGAVPLDLAERIAEWRRGEE